MNSARRSPPRKKKRPRTTKSSTTKRKSTTAGTRRRRSDRVRSRPRVAYLGLGSNVGDRGAHLNAALEKIESFAPVNSVSSFYGSDPVGHVGQRRFWNAVAEVFWTGSPEAMLRAVKAVERRGGRRPTFAGGPREIDVDILDLGGTVRRGRDPILPHPRLAERRFALAPLAEIAPRWRHPVSGLTAGQMLSRLPRKPGVGKIKKYRPRIKDVPR